MRSIAIIACIPLLAACGPLSYGRSADGNYTLSLAGKPGESPRELKKEMHAQAESLCGWPYLIRHTKQEDYYAPGSKKPHHHVLNAEVECPAHS